jgi:hypothetical protein
MGPMARKRRSKNRTSNAGTYFFITLAIAVLSALVAGGVYLKVNTETIVALNSDTLCPNSGAIGTTAVLLDTTDEISDTTKADIIRRIDETLDSLPRYSRLAIYQMTEDGLDKAVLAEVCNPGRLEDMDDLAKQGFTANPRIIEGRYNAFRGKVGSSIQTFFQKKMSAEQSPLFGSLQKLSLSLPRREKQIEGSSSHNTIIFVSDFWEHTEAYSIYRSGIDMEQFRDSRAQEKFGSKYENTDLHFWMIRRKSDKFTSQNLGNFVRKVFTEEFKSKSIKSFRILEGEL